jgi:hypothetical protein
MGQTTLDSMNDDRNPKDKVTISQIGPHLDSAVKQGLREQRWEAYRISPAVLYIGSLPPTEHVHLLNGDRVKATGYKRPSVGRCDLDMTCPRFVEKVQNLQNRAGVFIWLN